MSGEPRGEGGTRLKRVPVIVRSWDGPNSRVGLEMDLGQMPWGPFDALGKRLSLLLPVADNPEPVGTGSESEVVRALRHVEHAADRCAEFAQIDTGNQESWRRSHETWEWIRKYLTSLWVDAEVDGRREPPSFPKNQASNPLAGKGDSRVPFLPGAAATLNVAAKALRATPLARWREAIDPSDPAAPTREEAVQTLLGLARVLGVQNHKGAKEADDATGPRSPASEGDGSTLESGTSTPEESDPDQLSFDFARGYDEGYQMGRRVGMALGARKGSG